MLLILQAVGGWYGRRDLQRVEFGLVFPLAREYCLRYAGLDSNFLGNTALQL